MDLTTLTDRIEYVSAGYADYYNVDRTDEWILLKLTEEVGELAQAHLNAGGQGRPREDDEQAQEQQLADELADVVSMCLVYARRRGIDLEKAITDKWFKYEQFHRDRGFVTDN